MIKLPMKNFSFSQKKCEKIDFEGITFNLYKIKLLLRRGSFPKSVQLDRTYSTKPAIEIDGENTFPELAILKLFKKDGWEGVWVDTFHKKYLDKFPIDNYNYKLPDHAASLLNKIKSLNNSKLSGCWDIFLWKDGAYLFVESKGIPSNDKIRKTQLKWLKYGIQVGLKDDNYLLVEWDYI